VIRKILEHYKNNPAIIGYQIDMKLLGRRGQTTMFRWGSLIT